MVQCNHCKELYHKKCMKMSNKLFQIVSKARNVDIDAKDILWLECDECDKWYHKICMGISDEKYKNLQDSEEKWYCFGCSNNFLEK